MLGDFLPFLVDDPEAGFRPGTNYPGAVGSDGVFFVANDAGRLVRKPIGIVKIDVAAWRVRAVAGSSDEAGFRRAIAKELALALTAADEAAPIKRQGPARQRREDLLAPLRRIAELVGEAELIERAWGGPES